jgi:membrane protein implicated in regulation of membrane protease activity
MAGWTWCVIGLVLFVGELVIPSGFFLFFLGISGVIVGLITLGGISLSWAVQTVIFAVIAMALWFIFAGKARGLLGKGATGSEGPVGKIVTVIAAVGPGEHGTAELWGSNWRIKNVDDRPLAAGASALVVAAEGVTLHVRLTQSS